MAPFPGGSDTLIASCDGVGKALDAAGAQPPRSPVPTSVEKAAHERRNERAGGAHGFGPGPQFRRGCRLVSRALSNSGSGDEGNAHAGHHTDQWCEPKGWRPTRTDHRCAGADPHTAGGGRRVAEIVRAGLYEATDTQSHRRSHERKSRGNRRDGLPLHGRKVAETFRRIRRNL